MSATTSQDIVYVPITRYRDRHGLPSCAAGFSDGRVCPFHSFGTYIGKETCSFGEFATTLRRRDGAAAPGTGSLIPRDGCPLWTVASKEATE